jgi:DNA-binding CsgD family transcriptional regulator
MQTEGQKKEAVFANYFNFIRRNAEPLHENPTLSPFTATRLAEQILDTGNIFFLIIEEATHRILFASNGMKRIWGIDSREVIGKFLHELHVYSNLEDMAYIDKFYPQVTEIIQSATREELLNYRFSIGNRLKRPDDGREVFVLTQNRFLNLDSDGKPVYTLLLFSDITLYQTENKPFFYITMVENEVEEPIFTSFSKREREVIKQIAIGLTNQQIARNLFISKETVRNHRTNIFKKAGVKNMAELVVFALNNKLL